jgi:hypothetical protein
MPSIKRTLTIDFLSDTDDLNNLDVRVKNLNFWVIILNTQIFKNLVGA